MWFVLIVTYVFDILLATQELIQGVAAYGGISQTAQLGALCCIGCICAVDWRYTAVRALASAAGILFFLYASTVENPGKKETAAILSVILLGYALFAVVVSRANTAEE